MSLRAANSRATGAITDRIDVLLVDDDELWGRVTARLLEGEIDGAVVDTVNSLEEGRERFAATDPDCVVCDYQLGDGTGLALLETVRESHPKLPFILVTGRGDESIASEAIGCGVTDYIPKECDDDQGELLANRVTKAVQSYRTERALERERRGKNAVIEIQTATTSQRDLYNEFCSLLVDDHEYTCAWVGVKGETGRIVPQAVAGREGYVTEAIFPGTGDPQTTEPAVSALERKESVVSPLILEETDTDCERWRAIASRYGFDSGAGIPIAYEGIQYGVVGVYTSGTTIGRRRRRALEEYAEIVGYAHHTAEWKRSLLSTRPVAVDVELADETAPLVALATRLPDDVSVEVPSVVDRADGDTLYLARVTGLPAEEFRDCVTACPGLELRDLDSDRGDTRSFPCHLLARSRTPESILAVHGAQFDRTYVTDGGVVVAARLPDSGLVPEIVDALSNVYDDVAVSSIWSDTTDEGTKSAADLLEPLTTKQRDVLCHAYHDGYFELPRGSSATDLADQFDIARATLTQHLRASERKLLDQIFK